MRENHEMAMVRGGFSVKCDRCEQVYWPDHETPEKAREWAKERGWRTSDDGTHDFCWECVAIVVPS